MQFINTVLIKFIECLHAESISILNIAVHQFALSLPLCLQADMVEVGLDVVESNKYTLVALVQCMVDVGLQEL